MLSEKEIRFICVFLVLFVVSVCLSSKSKAQFAPDSSSVLTTLSEEREIKSEYGVRAQTTPDPDPEVAVSAEKRMRILDFGYGGFANQLNNFERFNTYSIGYATELKNGVLLELYAQICDLGQKPWPPIPVPLPPGVGPREITQSIQGKSNRVESLQGLHTGGQLVVTGGLGSSLLKLGRFDLSGMLGAGIAANLEGSLDDEAPNIGALDSSIDPVVHMEGTMRVELFSLASGAKVGVQATIRSLTVLLGDVSYRDMEGRREEYDAGTFSALQYDFGLFLRFNNN